MDGRTDGRFGHPGKINCQNNHRGQKHSKSLEHSEGKACSKTLFIWRVWTLGDNHMKGRGPPSRKLDLCVGARGKSIQHEPCLTLKALWQFEKCGKDKSPVPKRVV